MQKDIIKIIFISLDILFFIVMFYLSKIIRVNLELFGLRFDGINLKDFLFVIVILIILLYYEKIYNYRYDFWQESFKIEKAIFLSFFITMAILALTKINIQYSRVFIVIFFFNSALLMPVYKRIIKRVLFKFNFFKDRVLVIGKKAYVKAFKKEIKDNWYLGSSIDNKKFNTIIVVSNGLKLKSIDNIIEKNSLIYQNIFVVPYLKSINFVHSNILEYSNIRLNSIHIENRLLIKSNIYLKLIFDKFVTFLLIFPFIPLHIIISILIKLDSKGDIFYKQERLGKDGKIFKVYKYRTMYEYGDKVLKEYLLNHPEEIEYYEKYHKYNNDPRITKIGKFLRKYSLDELPQIINVLKGEMSLVGPRPYMLTELNHLNSDKNIILKLAPGITGLWQVSGRNNLSFKKRVELEKWYVKNWSIWLDITIIIKTIKVIITKDGAK